MDRLAAPAVPVAPTVVGIGASAGGLAALRAFFARVPERSGIAWVVVVHLSPEHESHLADLLQPHVGVPVLQVTGTVELEPDRVYVIPPNANLSAVDTHLRLSRLETERQQRAPIDHFLRTLAATHDGHSVGVILTGTGSDGALGIKAVKENNGFTVVQDPAEAEFDGMPRSALATGLVDAVLPLAEIPEAVMRFAHAAERVALPANVEEPGLEQDRLLQRLFAQVRARTGRDFSRYKRSTLLRRIQRRMQIREIAEFPAYLELLRTDADEARALADDVLINVTHFFRDPPTWEHLADEVVPLLFAGKAPEQSIRVWSVGCATGEEAYSLAILLLEAAARHEVAPQVQVFASDLHEHSLERAREGFYPGDIEADVSEERLKRFFHREDGGYRVRKDVRERVIFAPHNLLGDPPFSRLDLVSCRNLLIYLQRDVQRDILELFHYALRPEGVLVLGSSETVEGSDLFRVGSKPHCVYRKRNVPAPEPRLPVFPLTRARLPEGPRPAAHAAPPVGYGALHQTMVEQYAPPSMLVSPDGRVMHLSEHVGRYLVHPGGELTSSAFRLVREEFRIELRAALHAARERRQPTRTRPVQVRFNGESGWVSLDVRPTLEPDQDGFCLVIFDERPPGEPIRAEADGAASGHPEAPTAERASELEAELELTRQRLQALIEEFETSQEEMRASHEELQSANEELRSALEELETSKEELQSINEELQTVNQENRHKVEELSQLSSDLQNLLVATDIATLFLDRELRILRFTPRVGELFNVRPVDRGRPLSDLTHRLGYDGLARDAAEVLRSLVPQEREVSGEGGHWYLTRILPYRSTDDRIQGVVITLVDITARKEAEQAVQQSREVLAAEASALAKLHEASTRLWRSSDLQAGLAEILEAALSLLGAEMGNVHLLNPTSGMLEIVAQRGFQANFVDFFRQISTEHHSASGRSLRTGERIIVEDVETDAEYAPLRGVAAEAGYRAVTSSPLLGAGGEPLGMLSVHFRAPCRPSEQDLRRLDLYIRQAADFIERQRIEAALRQSEARHRTLFESVDEGVCLLERLPPRPDGRSDYRYLAMNPAMQAMFGIPDLSGQSIRDHFPDESEAWYDDYDRVLETGRPVRFERESLPQGLVLNMFVTRVDDGSEKRLLAVMQDVTERKRAEASLRETEERLRLFGEATSDVIWMRDAQGLRWEYLSPAFETVYGRERASVGKELRSWTELIVPADRDAVLAQLERVRAGERVSYEFRIQCPDGQVRWLRNTDFPMSDLAGRVQRIGGIGQDVTEQKRTAEALRELTDTLERRVEERTAELKTQIREREHAEEARREVLQQLVTAEEVERRRISQELHDQMGQQMTGLLLGLRAARQEAESPQFTDQLRSLERLAGETARDLQHLAVELRPPALDTLGLAAAVQNLVEDRSTRHGIEHDFHTRGLAGVRLAAEVETTIYRVVQEALTNVFRHAEAARVNVLVEFRDGLLRAIIEDDGSGFDVEATLASPDNAKRLGVRGMRERVALFGGELEIESSPGGGTSLYVRIPALPATEGDGE